MREAVRRRFRYILVDEFQDTNTVQFEILKLLAAGHGNVTVVGDDDQSIYKFRGAALSNILGFSAVYPHRTLVVLTRNYRSGQRILDAAHRLIAHNPDRLETREQIEKRLLHATLPHPGEIELLPFATLDAEASAVAARVKTMITEEGRAARDIAILVRSNRDAAPFLSALVAAGIPHEFSGNRGLFNREEVRLAIAFLRAITRRSDAQSLMLVAGSPIYAVPMTDLVQLADLARARRRSLHWALQEARSHGRGRDDRGRRARARGAHSRGGRGGDAPRGRSRALGRARPPKDDGRGALPVPRRHRHPGRALRCRHHGGRGEDPEPRRASSPW